MASKWERQVERNAKKANIQRKRNGVSPITQGTKRDEKIKGRSWILATFLVLVGLFYMFSFWETERNGLFWITIIMYFILAFVVFFLRRPFLGIGKSSLTTRKFAGFRVKKAEEISKIEIQPGTIVIEFTNNSSRWVFSRLINLYNMREMADELQEFAVKNKINFVKLV
jgi:hypothetical protein